MKGTLLLGDQSIDLEDVRVSYAAKPPVRVEFSFKSHSIDIRLLDDHSLDWARSNTGKLAEAMNSINRYAFVSTESEMDELVPQVASALACAFPLVPFEATVSCYVYKSQQVRVNA